VTLRHKYFGYLLVVHAVFAGCTIWFLRSAPVWLIGVEIFFVLSLSLGIRLVKALFEPLDLIRSGSSYMLEKELTTRFKHTGQQDIDELFNVYNTMVDNLRDERTHNEEQEHLLRQVMAESPGGVITLDVEGNIATINPAALKLLRQPDEIVIGRPLSDLDSPFARKLAEISGNGSQLLTISGRNKVRCQTGSFMDRGFPRRFFLLDELTEELHLNEKQAYEKLVRMMSHEVNNTCGAVQSLLQSCLAYRRHIDDEDRDDFTRALEVAIQRNVNLNAFMGGFADVVRLPKPSVQDCDPWEMATQVGLLFRNRCAESNIILREEFAKNLPRIKCDPVQFEQVLVNIVKNATEAIESTDKGGEIVLIGGKKDGRYFLAVQDTGPGLDQKVQDQIFTPFFTTRKQGQGIGLTMVQEILMGHGFVFSLENRVGGGAEFCVVFHRGP
jgi:nitrogen fixation/metabolism regulation signal transduction histidine kinase